MDKTKAPTEAAEEAVLPERKEPSLGATRQAVVSVLADAPEAMTIREIERAVAEVLPSSVRDPIENVVDTLLQDELVERLSDDTRRLQLSQRGNKFASGLRALAGG